MMTFGKRLEKVRVMHDLTQEAMATSVGVAQQTWSGYENDIYLPSAHVVWAFCGIYHVDRGWLTDGVGEMYRDGYYPGDPLGEPIKAEAFERERIRKMMLGEKESSGMVLRLTDDEVKMLRRVLDIHKGEDMVDGVLEKLNGGANP